MIREPSDAPDVDSRDELRDERQFLLRSLHDLDSEREAGDIDNLDYTTLRDDYTARAASVIARLNGGEFTSIRNPRQSARIKVLLIATMVILCASGIGWFMATQLGQRLPGQSLSGGIADSTASLLSQARAINFSDPAKAVDLYSQVLNINPDNIEALTYRAWLIALVSRDASDDLKVLAFATATDGLGRAIAIDPKYADAHCFLGIIRFRIAADAKGAKPELQICQDLNPPATVKGFVDSIVAEVDAALDN
jgi:tetratricopeptide (TPR) repeat protein